MKLGFLTGCLLEADLPEVVRWAATTGYDSLEVSAWPASGVGAHGPAHVDVGSFDRGSAESILALFGEHGMTISALGYYDNNLHGDPKRRAEIHDHLRRCIEAASLLECPLVGTFVGRDPAKSVAENLAEAERILPPIIEYAAERSVRLVVENCPMEGWHPDGYPGNLAYSPELWEWMFDLGLYLNYDPSHLVWLGIDPVAALRPYVDRVLHAQAKDAEVDVQARNRYSVFGRTIDREHEWDVGWWRYRVPGRGQVDWRALVDTLDQAGFDGALAVEHEDPVWGGNDDMVRTGLEIAYDTLRPLVRS